MPCVMLGSKAIYKVLLYTLETRSITMMANLISTAFITPNIVSTKICI